MEDGLKLQLIFIHQSGSMELPIAPDVLGFAALNPICSLPEFNEELSPGKARELLGGYEIPKVVARSRPGLIYGVFVLIRHRICCGESATITDEPEVLLESVRLGSDAVDQVPELSVGLIDGTKSRSVGKTMLLSEETGLLLEGVLSHGT